MRLLPVLFLVFGCARALQQPYQPQREGTLLELNAQSLGLMEAGNCTFGANPPVEWGLGFRESSFTGKKSHMLVLQYKGAGGFGIQGGESLMIDTDGRIKSYNVAPLDIEKKALGSYLLERAYYAASLDVFRQIASAKKVEVTVKGRDRSEGFCVPDFSRANMRRWLKEEMKADKSRAEPSPAAPPAPKKKTRKK